MQVLTWIIRLILAMSVLGVMASCTMLGLNYASLDIDNKPDASPSIPDPFDRAFTKATLETELYGPWPKNLPISAGERRMVDPDYLDGRGTLEEIMLTIGEGDGARTFPIVLAVPNTAKLGPVPVIISQTFSGNCSVFPDLPVSNTIGEQCSGSGMTGVGGFIATQIFGTYIAEAPVERYFEAGFAYASMTGNGFIPDRSGVAQQVMQALGPAPQPTSTLMGWAYGFHAAADVLMSDTRIDDQSVLALGHSRYGKAALVAAAWSDNIQAAIAHQSGFAGGSSSRSETGETLKRMVKSYPHWVRPGLSADLEAGQTLTLDQHFLLALSAPKPVFLGNGRRDVWSDPNSSFRLAQAADKVHKQLGATGLTATNMRAFDPSATLSYWLRTGGHSVVSEDIDAFIAFASAHFIGSDAGVPALQMGE
ncbi:MAG: hypothetical protein AAGI14_00555 [Pseudomonadota bacterium]